MMTLKNIIYLLGIVSCIVSQVADAVYIDELPFFDKNESESFTAQTFETVMQDNGGIIAQVLCNKSDKDSSKDSLDTHPHYYCPAGLAAWCISKEESGREVCDITTRQPITQVVLYKHHAVINKWEVLREYEKAGFSLFAASYAENENFNFSALTNLKMGLQIYGQGVKEFGKRAAPFFLAVKDDVNATPIIKQHALLFLANIYRQGSGDILADSSKAEEYIRHVIDLTPIGLFGNKKNNIFSLQAYLTLVELEMAKVTGDRTKMIDLVREVYSSSSAPVSQKKHAEALLLHLLIRTSIVHERDILEARRIAERIIQQNRGDNDHYVDQVRLLLAETYINREITSPSKREKIHQKVEKILAPLAYQEEIVREKRYALSLLRYIGRL